MTQTKRCCSCGKTKAVGEFYDHPHTRDRLQSWCMECMNASSRRRYAAKNAKKPPAKPKRTAPEPAWVRWKAITEAAVASA